MNAAETKTTVFVFGLEIFLLPGVNGVLTDVLSLGNIRVIKLFTTQSSSQDLPCSSKGLFQSQLNPATGCPCAKLTLD